MYQFTGLRWADYTVNETMKPGYILISPLEGTYQVTINQTNISRSNLNFTNAALPPGNWTICGWVASNCNVGALYIPNVQVRFAVNVSDLKVPGRYFENITDSQGHYCVSGLPTNVTLYGMAFSPAFDPDIYNERPIHYQIGTNPLITCNDNSCNPQIPPHQKDTMLQVNWNLVQNPFNLPP
jgi:hypothetical protein